MGEGTQEYETSLYWGSGGFMNLELFKSKFSKRKPVSYKNSLPHTHMYIHTYIHACSRSAFIKFMGMPGAALHAGATDRK